VKNNVSVRYKHNVVIINTVNSEGGNQNQQDQYFKKTNFIENGATRPNLLHESEIIWQNKAIREDKLKAAIPRTDVQASAR
jgi:hypothetical protein